MNIPVTSFKQVEEMAPGDTFVVRMPQGGIIEHVRTEDGALRVVRDDPGIFTKEDSLIPGSLTYTRDRIAITNIIQMAAVLHGDQMTVCIRPATAETETSETETAA